MRSADAPGYCDCGTPDRRSEDGNVSCFECGRQVPEERDRLLVTVARSVASVDRRLDELTKALARNGGAP